MDSFDLSGGKFSDEVSSSDTIRCHGITKGAVSDNE